MNDDIIKITITLILSSHEIITFIVQPNNYRLLFTYPDIRNLHNRAFVLVILNTMHSKTMN